jgi:hypothetical protein
MKERRMETSEGNLGGAPDYLGTVHEEMAALERQREGVDRILPTPDAYTLEATVRVGY